MARQGYIRLTRQNFDSSKCTTCSQSKLTRQPSHLSFRPTTERLERIHVDLVGGGKTLELSAESTADTDTPTISAGGNRYAMVLTDDYTKFRWIFFMARKDQAALQLQSFITFCRTQYGKIPAHFRSDGGGEFGSKSFNKYLTDHGVQWEVTAPYTPDQDGVAERSIRTVVQMSRSMIISSKLPHSLWAEAFKYSVQLINSTPTSSTRLLKPTTPYQAFHGSQPDYHHLRPFGCLVFTRQTPTDRLDPRGSPAAYLGFSSTQIHRLWNGKSISVSRDVKFHEDQWYTDYLTSNPSPDSFSTVAAAAFDLATPIPRNYAEATSSPRASDWRQAIEAEMAQFQSKQT